VCWNLECLAILLVFILLLLLLVMIRPWGSLTLINLWFHRWRVFFWFSRNKNSFPVYDILSRAELTDGDLVAGKLRDHEALRRYDDDRVQIILESLNEMVQNVICEEKEIFHLPTDHA